MDNKFLTFIKPYLSYIDNGDLYRRPFSLLYSLLGILNLIFPIYVFYMAADNGVFKLDAKYIIVFLLVWIIVAFAGWLSFQLWWDRRTKIGGSSSKGDEFIATPVFSHLIQTSGEWLGTWIGIVGFGATLVITIILGDEGSYFGNRIGLSFLESGWIAIVLMPIYGFLIIVLARFVAEQARALASIANNTKKD